MKKTAVNPYLPSWEYVPDGEPYVFDNRIYIYGSHDLAHGTSYCQGDYVGWSAPVDDPGNWTYEGVIYKKNQDPDNPDGEHNMFAPDVAKGPDGRYYLYYGLSNVTYIGVAVSDSPQGPFEYYGQIRDGEGKYPEGLAFDPGIYVEGDNIYLYYGFAMKERLPETSKHAFLSTMIGGYMVRLDRDMKTVISEPILIANGNQSAKGTSFEGHPFFEASSLRKIGDRYYFIYSSLQGHELCYATSSQPEGPFEFGGVIISNADLGISKEPKKYYANNHGSLVAIEGQYYIFYHRHTHGTHYSRQGCAEKIQILEDGSIPQVEMTSCGLNEGALPSDEIYGAYILCNLMGPDGADKMPGKRTEGSTMPYLVESNEENRLVRRLYLTNLYKGARCGFKYLNYDGTNQVELVVRGKEGQVILYKDEAMTQVIGTGNVSGNEDKWQYIVVDIDPIEGDHPLFVEFAPKEGTMEFLEFCLR